MFQNSPCSWCCFCLICYPSDLVIGNSNWTDPSGKYIWGSWVSPEYWVLSIHYWRDDWQEQFLDAHFSWKKINSTSKRRSPSFRRIILSFRLLIISVRNGISSILYVVNSDVMFCTDSLSSIDNFNIYLVSACMKWFTHFMNSIFNLLCCIWSVGIWTRA